MIEQLISDFSNNQLSNFLRNNNSSFVDYLEDFSELISDNEKFTNLYKLGEIEYNNTDKLIVFTCMFIGELTSRSARKTQFELAKKVLKEDFNDGAVFVFYDKAGRFRFSFIRRNYGDRKQKYTPWKRYTYFVEPDAATNRTFKERIGNCKFDSLDTIQEAFSVEKLTKDFYKELSDWYFWAIKNVSFPNNVLDDNDDDKYNPESMIRLITRLIFVWFLKQKGLIRNELFETSFISNTLKEFDPESDTQHNYYRAILQNLFFATLNQEMHKRGFAEDKDFFNNRATNSIKNLYRFENEFKCENPSKIMELFNQIPFLNGGLFECLDRKEKDGEIYDWDGFSRNPKFQAKVPNMLFFAKDTKVDLSDVYNDKKFKSVHVAGIIEILNRYNFTVEENTPVEIEVALDPELLGKVFENLLGAYNPETQETARKQTGSFYTPREIVNYMVDESLIAYYRTKVPNVDEETLRLVLSYDDQPVNISKSQCELLIQATYNCKILDPACGSGAFPMGALQQMVHILKKLDKDSIYWNNVVMAQAMSDFEKSEKLSEDDMDEIREEIEKTFDTGLNYPDYARKLHLIKNCIYGVDIQSIAVQISKLRFFISLVTEQKRNPNPEENFGIKPLPNLETKFVAANTLIGLEKSEEELVLLSNDHIKTLIDKLQNIRFRQFLVTNVTEKKRLRDKDEKLRLEIENEVSRLYVKHMDDQLDNYKKELSLAEKQLSLLNKMPDNIQENISTDLFGTETKTTYNYTKNKRKELKGRIKLLNEDIQKGADYSRLESIVKLAKQLTSWNPYDQNQSSPFFDPEWMFGLAKHNEGYFDVVIGNPPYISYYSNTGSSLTELEKKYFVSNYKSVKKENDRINSMNLMLEKGLNLLKEKGHLSFITNKTISILPSYKEVRKFILSISRISYIISDLDPFEAIVDCVVIGLNKENVANYKIRWNKGNLQYHDLKDNSLLLLNSNYEFHFSLHQNINSKIENAKNKLEDLLLINRGVNIGGCFNDFLSTEMKSQSYCKYLSGTKNIKRYLYFWELSDGYMKLDTELEKKLKLKGATIALGNPERYKKERLFIPESGQILMAAYCNEDIYSAYGVMVGTNANPGISLKYSCALLNSKLFTFYAIEKEILRKGKKATPHVGVKGLNSIPIHICNKDTEKKITSIVDEIINNNDLELNSYTSNLIQKIDNLVYRLYNLTYDEVKVIDPEIEKKISEDEYNAIEV